MTIPYCPYCGKRSSLVKGSKIYPRRRDLSEKAFYLCRPCWAYVGTHPDTTVPLGTLANEALRLERSRTHAIFDPIWKEGHLTRPQAYAWLAAELGISSNACHIAKFDLETCKKAIHICAGRRAFEWP